MTVTLRSFHPHLNIYHHQEGLLFQFILSDFLAIYKESKPLHSLTTPPCTADQFDDFLIPISRLVGTSQDTMRLFVWTRDTSLLSKFKTYCALYAQNGQQNKRILQLQQYANQAWLYSMHCLDLLHSLKEVEQNVKAGESLCKTKGKLLTCFQRISKTLSPLFETYSSDENVLFFILRHQNELNEIYGEHFVEQMLTKMHPEGLAGIEEFLLKRYSKRGFDHLLPIIKATLVHVAAV